jgi:hypothetical protein
VTGLLTTCGQGFLDWSAPYRLFSCDRLPVNEIFSVIRRAVLAELPPHAPLTVAIDDSLLRKAGLRIPGVAWRRDPLGPHFQTNFVRAQRILQFSAAVPLSQSDYRMVPITFRHAPTPVKPSRKATPEQLADYRRAARQARLPLLAVRQIVLLRQQMDTDLGAALRLLLCVVDGGYTNATVFKDLPPRTTLIGRIRKDARLFSPPEPKLAAPSPGRPRHYGAPAPTPEQLRTDDSLPWTSLEVSVSGAPHQIRVKSLRPVLWRTAGLRHTLQLIVIAPLCYRLRKGSKLLYRQPAFLICTDPEMDLPSVVQAFVQRWGIEVNFREQKTLLGVGQAQVRHPHSVESVPALQVAAYAMLQLACLHTLDGPAKADQLPPPKWAPTDAPVRFSTQRALSQLRAEVWGRGLGLTNFSGFASRYNPALTPEKFPPDLASAVLYAVG